MVFFSVAKQTPGAVGENRPSCPLAATSESHCEFALWRSDQHPVSAKTDRSMTNPEKMQLSPHAALQH